MLGIILILFFIFFSCCSFLIIRLLQIRADRLIKEAEADLDALFMEIQAKRVLYIRIASMFIMALFGLIITGSLIVAFIFGTIGYFMPRFYFRIQYNRRLAALNSQLVSAIDMMSNALKSGSNLPQAITLIEKEMGAPISQEFALVLKEMAMGVTLEEAFSNMSRRVGSEEFDIVVTATNISRETGGNLAEVYERIAKTIRDRDEMLGKIKALTAEGKFQGIFVGLLPFLLAFVLHLMNPEYIKPLFTTTLGYIIIGVFIIMELMGAFFIKKIITIDV
jgi:tight adherence protein B